MLQESEGIEAFWLKFGRLDFGMFNFLYSPCNECNALKKTVGQRCLLFLKLAFRPSVVCKIARLVPGNFTIQLRLIGSI